MSSDREYLDYILDQLSDVDGISCRGMMGEYIIYLHGKVIGGIYDNRFLIKAVPSAIALMPDSPHELPYPGAKEMLLVDDVDNREFLAELLTAIYSELPEPSEKQNRHKKRES